MFSHKNALRHLSNNKGTSSNVLLSVFIVSRFSRECHLLSRQMHENRQFPIVPTRKLATPTRLLKWPRSS